MKIGTLDMTNINGQLSLIFTAETPKDYELLDTLRVKTTPLDLAKRHLDDSGVGRETFVITLDHMLEKELPKSKGGKRKK